MSTMAMTARMADVSPQLRARIAGVFYLLNFLTGSLAAVLVGRLAGYGHAALLIATACYVVVTLLLYYLFEPVSRRLSLLAAFFSLVGCAIGVLSLFHLAPFNLNNLVFFGFYCLVIGYLIFRSTFMPRILGVLMAVAGLGWLTFLSPSLANNLTPYNVASGLVGEGSLTLWLLAVGVNLQRWNERASAARTQR
jgi:fucose 4-O-acetylase-like acetyltransferase